MQYFQGQFEERCHTTGSPNYLSYFTAICSIIFLLLNIPGNLLVILAVAKDPFQNLRTPFNYLMTNLAFADLLVGTVNEPLSVYIHIKEALDLSLSSEEVETLHMTYFISCTASVLSLGTLAIERYLAIRKPHTYQSKVTGKRILGTVAGIWGISLLLPNLYFEVGYITYAFIFANTSLVAVFAISCFIYGLMLEKFYKRRVQYTESHNLTRNSQIAVSQPRYRSIILDNPMCRSQARKQSVKHGSYSDIFSENKGQTLKNERGKSSHNISQLTEGSNQIQHELQISQQTPSKTKDQIVKHASPDILSENKDQIIPRDTERCKDSHNTLQQFKVAYHQSQSEFQHSSDTRLQAKEESSQKILQDESLNENSQSQLRKSQESIKSSPVPDAILSSSHAMEQKITKRFLVVLFAMLFCYGPSTVFIYVMSFCETCQCETLHWFRDLQFLFVIMNSCFNFYCYAICSPRFRNAFKHLLHVKRSENTQPASFMKVS